MPRDVRDMCCMLRVTRFDQREPRDIEGRERRWKKLCGRASYERSFVVFGRDGKSWRMELRDADGPE